MSATPHTSLFTQVDRSDDPDFFVRFMDEAQKPAAIQASKRLMLERAALIAGDAVLDVDCGPGTDLYDIAAAVGPEGRVVGVDASEVMIAEARRRAEEAGLELTFDVGEATALPYADGDFDVCRAARVLEHVPDPAGVLSEIVRVTRNRGRVVVLDFDWDTLIVDHPDKETTRTIVRTYSDSIRNGWIGRQLPRLLDEPPLELQSIDPLQVFVHYELAELFLGSHVVALQRDGVLTPDRARTWWEHLEQAHEHGNLLVGFTAFVVAAVKR